MLLLRACFGLGCLLAELLALPAGLGADGTVLVLLGVALTLVATDAAGQPAGFEHRTQRYFIAASAAGRH